MRPPNITIPKTLAALPNNQYATPFEEDSGKNFLLDALAFSFWALEIVWLKDPNGDGFLDVPAPPSCKAAGLLFNRMFRNNVDFKGMVLWRNVGRDCFMH